MSPTLALLPGLNGGRCAASRHSRSPSFRQDHSCLPCSPGSPRLPPLPPPIPVLSFCPIPALTMAVCFQQGDTVQIFHVHGNLTFHADQHHFRDLSNMRPVGSCWLWLLLLLSLLFLVLVLVMFAVASCCFVVRVDVASLCLRTCLHDVLIPGKKCASSVACVLLSTSAAHLTLHELPQVASTYI